MRASRSILLLLAPALLAACSAASDPEPEDRVEDVALLQGRAEQGTVRTEPDYEYLEGESWRWEDHVETLPPGFRYETDAVGIGETGSLLIDYYLAVDPDAEPGHYDFHVDVIVSQWNALFEQEVRIRFRVEVRRERGHHPVEMQVRQAVPEEGEAEFHLTVE